MTFCQRGRRKITNPQVSKENFKEKETLNTGSDFGLTPGQTVRLTDGRKITLAFTLVSYRTHRLMEETYTNRHLTKLLPLKMVTVGLVETL
jgi:hypothetical protein